MKRIFKWLGKGIWGGVKLFVLLLLVIAVVAGIGIYHEYAKPVLELKQQAEEIAEKIHDRGFSLLYDQCGL